MDHALVLVSSKTPFPLTSSVGTYYRHSPRKFNLHFCHTFEKAIHFSKAHDLTVFLLEINSYDDLRGVVTLYRAIQSKIREGRTKVTAIVNDQDEGFNKVLHKMNCEVIFGPNASVDQVRRALDRLLKNMTEVSPLNKEDAPILNRKGKARLTESSFGQGLKKKIHLLPPLDSIRDDCWLIDPKDITRVNQTWIIHLLGPGMNLGRWKRVGSSRTALEGRWYWICRGEDESLSIHDGVWTFYGRQPELRGDHWLMISRDPQFYYSQGDQTIAYRFRLDTDGHLCLTANSRATLAKRDRLLLSHQLQLILKSNFIPATNYDRFRDTSKFPPGYNKGPQSTGSHSSHSTQPKDPYSLAEQKLSPNKILFSIVTDVEEKSRYCREASKTTGQIQFWTPQQTLRFHATVQNYNPQVPSVLIQYPLHFNKTSLFQSISKLAPSTIFFNLNLPSAALFFKTDIRALHYRDEALEVSMPESLYEVKRRAHLRLKIDDLLQKHSSEKIHQFIRMEKFPDGISGPDFKLLDISEGGMRARIRMSEGATPWTRRKQISGTVFCVYGMKVPCDIEVRWVKPVPNSDGRDFEVGLQFLGMSEDGRERVRLCVFEESMEYIKACLL